MGIDIRIVVVGSAQAVGEGGRATGAIACPWLAATVACPHQAVLFVVAEVLALTVPCHTTNYILDVCQANKITGRVTAQAAL